MNVFIELKKQLKTMEENAIEVPKQMKILMAKYSNQWVVHHYPEWVIQIGQMPKEFKNAKP